MLRQPALDRQIAGARDLGLRHVRIAVRWNEVEKSMGRYDWGVTDQRLRPIIAAGLSPLLTLIGPNDNYDAPNGGNAVAAASKDSVAGFARFAAAVVQRYNGPEFRYEIWNEPNLRTFWKPNPDGKLYAMLAASSCQAMRAVKPDAKIYVLGMNGTPIDKDVLGHYGTWSKAALQPDMISCASGFSLHPYGRRLPESYLSDLNRIDDMLDAGGQKKDVIISEWGTPVAKKWNLTADDQINHDTRILLTGAMAGEYTNLFTMMAPGANNDDSEQTFGLLDFNGNPKPSYAIVKNLLNRVGDLPFKSICSPCEGSVYGLRFEGPKREASYVLWTNDGTGSIPRPSDLGSKAQIVDLVTGRSQALPQGPLAASVRPVLVVGGPS
ncbi:hypothetical protein [Arboricoccus pini]|nr:hypothetical protein [Arboricoccus pini]